MNEVQIFNFESSEVRTVVVNSQPYFVLKDVCEVLGLTNPTVVADRLDEDERTKFNLGRQGEANVINESGLYKVIFQSKKESAKKFTKWVTSEVLPSIRRNGMYKVPENPMEALKLMFEAQSETNAKVEVIEDKIQYIEENTKLDPSEYNYLSKRINERVKEVKNGLHESFNREQNSRFYKSINADIKTLTGIDTRSQLRKKDYRKVLDLVNNWYPSPVTLMVIRELGSDFNE